MKRKKTLNKLAALLLSAVMALSLNTAVLAAETNRHAAIDKTAAELKDGRTDVTLAIGAGSEKTSSDVVFVLDKSTSCLLYTSIPIVFCSEFTIRHGVTT